MENLTAEALFDLMVHGSKRERRAADRELSRRADNPANDAADSEAGFEEYGHLAYP